MMGMWALRFCQDVLELLTTHPRYVDVEEKTGASLSVGVLQEGTH
jgi:hypothetical protein